MIRSHPVGICVVLLPGWLKKNAENCTDLCEAAIVHMSVEFPVILGGARELYMCFIIDGIIYRINITLLPAVNAAVTFTGRR